MTAITASKLANRCHLMVHLAHCRSRHAPTDLLGPPSKLVPDWVRSAATSVSSLPERMMGIVLRLEPQDGALASRRPLHDQGGRPDSYALDDSFRSSAASGDMARPGDRLEGCSFDGRRVPVAPIALHPPLPPLRLGACYDIVLTQSSR